MYTLNLITKRSIECLMHAISVSISQMTIIEIQYIRVFHFTTSYDRRKAIEQKATAIAAATLTPFVTPCAELQRLGFRHI